MKRIFDYIKSWLYYPKMEKYFDDRDMSMCNRWKNKKFARFKYAWWHCHAGKLRPTYDRVTDKKRDDLLNKGVCVGNTNALKEYRMEISDWKHCYRE